MISAVEIGSPSDEDLDLVPGLVLHSVNSMPCANGTKGVLKHLRTEIWSTLEFGSPLALEFVEPYAIITESVHRAPRPSAPRPSPPRPSCRSCRPSSVLLVSAGARRLCAWLRLLFDRVAVAEAVMSS